MSAANIILCVLALLVAVPVFCALVLAKRVDAEAEAYHHRRRNEAPKS